MQIEDNRRLKHHQEQQLLQQQASVKHTTSRSNKLTTAARRKSLEEIFTVLLMSAEMSRELERKEQKTQQPGENNLLGLNSCVYIFDVWWIGWMILS
jgi:hypothetical protein